MEERSRKLDEIGARIVALVQSVATLKEDWKVEAEQEVFPGSDAESSRQSISNGKPKEKEKWNHLLPVPPMPSHSPQRMQAAGNVESAPMLDAILKNREALQMVLMNQDMLKRLLEKLQKSLSALEEKVQAIERQMGTLSQFTEELNQVGDDIIWG